MSSDLAKHHIEAIEKFIEADRLVFHIFTLENEEMLTFVLPTKDEESVFSMLRVINELFGIAITNAQDFVACLEELGFTQQRILVNRFDRPKDAKTKSKGAQ